MDHLLAIIRQDREWHDQAARKQLVRSSRRSGPKHPATVGGRRKLSSVLFSLCAQGSHDRGEAQ